MKNGPCTVSVSQSGGQFMHWMWLAFPKLCSGYNTCLIRVDFFEVWFWDRIESVRQYQQRKWIIHEKENEEWSVYCFCILYSCRATHVFTSFPQKFFMGFYWGGSKLQGIAGGIRIFSCPSKHTVPRYNLYFSLAFLLSLYLGTFWK